jgi:hypothetical protein
MTLTQPAVCIKCKHFIGFNKNGAMCDAFPDDGIPSEIWNAENDHSEHVEGDHGILFELDEEKDKEE